ncbi:MAG: mechanosensitive ion channel [Pseudonocardiaceae bacterium]|nr:mechanosensitive ion channel [Pseudonocardiaceae bacterium]
MNSAVLAQPQCADNDGSPCQWVYQWTNLDWLARFASTLMDTAISILLIVAVAYGLRWVLHRAIKRLTNRVVGRDSDPTRAQRVQRRQQGVGESRADERRAQRAGTIGSLLRSTSTFVIYGVAFVMVLAEFGINVGPILASAGVIGLAIGFGAQNLVRDFLSGIFMMLEDQYGVGDWVDIGEASGEVEAVGLRITTLRDLGGAVWYVRNGEILRVGNFSQGFAVAVVDVPVARHADTALANRVAGQAAREVAEENPSDVTAPPDMLGVQSVTPYAVTLRITAKTKPGRQWAVQRALNARVQSALNAEGIPAPNVNGLPVPST